MSTPALVSLREWPLSHRSAGGAEDHGGGTMRQKGWRMPGSMYQNIHKFPASATGWKITTTGDRSRWTRSGDPRVIVSTPRRWVSEAYVALSLIRKPPSTFRRWRLRQLNVTAAIVRDNASMARFVLHRLRWRMVQSSATLGAMTQPQMIMIVTVAVRLPVTVVAVVGPLTASLFLHRVFLFLIVHFTLGHCLNSLCIGAVVKQNTYERQNLLRKV